MGKWYISTIDPHASALARDAGLGIEIAETCTAAELDLRFSETDAVIREKLQKISHVVMHGPFNELFPCAIDPKARELARMRYRQAAALAVGYGAEKLVLHGGYNPWLYYPCWYHEQSVEFWRAFLPEIPEGLTICLENVLEEEPRMLADIIGAVGDPRLRLCLDIGHAHAYSGVPIDRWLSVSAPFLSHLHIHNNDGKSDSHSGLEEGTLPVAEVLERVRALCPEASCTLEIPDSRASLIWLQAHGLI